MSEGAMLTVHNLGRGSFLNVPLTVTAIFISVLCCYASPSDLLLSDGRTGHGTLGLLIVTREGMVLAADSRTSYGNGRHDDRAVKVFKLGEKSGCMIAGTVVKSPSAKTRGFDLPGEIHKITDRISQNTMITDDPAAFASWLETALGTAVQEGYFDLPAPEFFDDDPEVASLLIAGYSVIRGGAAANIPDRYMDHGYKTRILLKGQTEIRGGPAGGMYTETYSVEARNYRVLEVDGPGPLAILLNGNDQLAKAMLRRQKHFTIVTMRGDVRDIDLQDAGKNPSLETYFRLKDTGQTNAMALGDAVRLAEAIIGENIQLAGDDLGIGGQIDIATITREHGFVWVPGHDPSSKSR